MSAISIGKLRYDIVSDTSSFEKGVKGSRREASKLAREWKESLTPIERLKLRQKQLNEQLLMGKRATQSYNHEMAKAHSRYVAETNAIKGHTRALNRDTIAKRKNAGAWNVMGAGVSGLGMGGASAGLGRLAGLASLGPEMALAAGLFGGLKMVKDSIAAAAELEQAVVSLQVIMGDFKGEQVANQLRELARQTPLTSQTLIKAAKTWASYGNSTVGITDTMKRMGDVSGGNAEQMHMLTVAMAQVTAQGKLMGQEKNQLVNAGFSLKAIADAAGISMSEFADAMEDGAIKAEHVGLALHDVTSEGGIFFQNMERQAQTLNGQMNQLSASWTRMLEALGESGKGPFSVIVKEMKSVIDEMTEIIEWYERTRPQGNDGAAGGGSSFFGGVGTGTGIGLLADAIGLFASSVEEGNAAARAAADAAATAEYVAGLTDEERKQYEEDMKLESLAGDELREAKLRILRENRLAKAQEEMVKAYEAQKKELDKEIERRKDIDYAKRMLGMTEGMAEIFADYKNTVQDIRKQYEKDEITRETAAEAMQREDELYAKRRAEQQIEDDREAAEDMKRHFENSLKEVDKTEKKELAEIDKATKAGPAFGPGSKEEYYFLRDKALADKKHQQAMAIAQKAQAQRDDINNTLRNIDRNTAPTTSGGSGTTPVGNL